MPFLPPPWAPQLPDPPDSSPLNEFMLSEENDRHPLQSSRPPFICGLTGKQYSAVEVKERVKHLAKGLSKELGWQPNNESPWKKVAALFSINAIDYLPVCWAVHRLNGILSPANAVYSAAELEYQLKDSGASCLFTCLPLLETSLQAARKVGIPNSRVFLLDVPEQVKGGKSNPAEFKSVDQLIELGTGLSELDPLKWEAGQGARQVAFLSYSSGTSGLPKGVMISHRNLISNVMQLKYAEKPFRDKDNRTISILGLLPMSHIYGLVFVTHSHVFRGDSVIVLPKFEFPVMLGAIQRFKIEALYLVPPILIVMSKSKPTMDKYDLNSVKWLMTGAAPLGEETANALTKQHPGWIIRQAYGMTESCTVACSTSPHDIMFGSSGSLIPGYEARLVTPEGEEITEYDKPGELLVKSPSVVLGYLGNEKATKETFEDGWCRTGDEALVRKSPKGFEHVFIVDRIKELIKVQGFQVAPAELEAHLLTHPAVADCCVVQVPHEKTGEAPKAFVVKSKEVGLEESDKFVARQIQRHVREHKAKHKWLTGGVEFIDVIPKSPSGKILRRLLRDKDKESRRKEGAKI